MPPHWPVTEPASPAAPEPAATEPVGSERLPEGIAEILEIFFGMGSALTAEFIDLHQRAGCRKEQPAPAPAAAKLVPEPGSAWSKPGASDDRRLKSRFGTPSATD
jgi:hypothetical protein